MLDFLCPVSHYWVRGKHENISPAVMCLKEEFTGIKAGVMTEKIVSLSTHAKAVTHTP